MTLSYEAVRLKKTHVPTVDETKDPVDLTEVKIVFTIFFKNPETSITPPKIIAEKINHIVLNIPNIPPDVNNSLTISLEVEIEIVPYNDFIIPTKRLLKLESLMPDTSLTRSGWKISAKITPKSVPQNKDGRAFVFL